jgi:type II secretory pathway pseudopilin PulG
VGSVPRMRRMPVPSERTGATLVEVLVALATGGILAGTIATVLVAHGRFAAVQTAREEVQQNARATLELITSELRGVAHGAITVAEDATIAFRLPRAWGVVCRHLPDRLSVLFPSGALPMLRADDDLLALPPVGTATEWRFLPVHGGSGDAVAAAECAALNPTGGGGDLQPWLLAPRADTTFPRTLGIVPGEAGLPPGAPVYVHDEVRYAVASSGAAGWWIRRNTGPAMLMHPLTGPVPPTGGLRLVYLDEHGAVIADRTAAEVRERIRGVEITVVMLSRTHFRGEPLRDSVTARVQLRNPR